MAIIVHDFGAEKHDRLTWRRKVLILGQSLLIMGLFALLFLLAALLEPR